MSNAVPRGEHRGALLARIGAEYPEADLGAVQAVLAVVDFAALTVLGADAHFARYGLSQGRFGVLMVLYLGEERRWTPATLADAVGSSRATLTGLLKGLEDDGWIERRPNPDDGRSAFIAITRSGTRRLRKLLPDHFRRVGRLFDDLTKKERADLLALLAKLRPAMQRRVDGLD